MYFIEWSIPHTHDVLFGKPQLVKYNPNIDWHGNSILYSEDSNGVDEDEFKTEMESVT